MSPHTCPLCFTPLRDYVPAVESPEAPTIGDIVICEGCAGYLCFDGRMQLSLVSEPHLSQIHPDFRLLMDQARDALVDKWLATHPPTMFAWVHCEVRRKKLAGQL